MPLARMDHFAIRTAKLKSTRDFYIDVIGLTEGMRPPFKFPGHWLYCGEQPVVHLIGHDPGNAAIKHAAGERTDEQLEGSTGSVDHIAFRAEDTPAALGCLLDTAACQGVESILQGVAHPRRRRARVRWIQVNFSSACVGGVKV